VTQADGAGQRNVLLDRLVLERDRDVAGLPINTLRIAGATWQRSNIENILAALALPPKSPLSIIVVETYHDVGDLADPIGGALGHVRIVRVSPLTAVPTVC
jgi:hypothetical protein